MNQLTICIPTYEMRGYGHVFLEKSFNILVNQTFKNFDVVISDHSKDNKILDLCEKYKDRLRINYYRNLDKRGSSSANINNAIKKAEGKIIKILFQDDFLYDNNSLDIVIKNFNLNEDKWVATACTHSSDGKHFFKTFYPKYNNLIQFGNNTISSPSVISIKNENPLLFDENLIWLMDCDFYKRYHDKFGNPKIINQITVVNKVGPHQVSKSIVNKYIKFKELLYVLFKSFKYKRIAK